MAEDVHDNWSIKVEIRNGTGVRKSLVTCQCCTALHVESNIFNWLIISFHLFRKL